MLKDIVWKEDNVVIHEFRDESCDDEICRLLKSTARNRKAQKTVGVRDTALKPL